jgi:dihydrofolate reductase
MALRAIAAMSLNRVIGKDGKIPWHVPEEMAWFKKMTMGGAVLMGGKTYDSLGGPLPNRRNLVATRGGRIAAGVEIVSNLETFRPDDYPGDIWVIGGAEIYREMLPRCEELYLSVIQRNVEGDVFFPEFEDKFEMVGTVMRRAEFEIRRYRRIMVS